MINLFSSEKSLWNRYNNIISSIGNLETELKTLNEQEFKDRTKKLKQIAKLNETSFNKQIDEKIIIESFGLVREASRRTLGLRHYDTQILGGLVLNEGKIAEMRTGEGKTLVATAPALKNALTEKGVHIVTVNEYLARRDAEWMNQLYRYLDIRVGLITADLEFNSDLDLDFTHLKRVNYNRDITYVTNSTLGFDYLYDNLAVNKDDQVQRPFNYCIIDEVDSILIDEARTPLIISTTTEVDIEKIIMANEAIKFLEEVIDFEIDQKAKNVSLTPEGLVKLEKILKVPTLYDLKNPWIPFILNALRAKTLYIRNVNYIIKDKEIVIVDEFTGRIMEGRRWSDGLHSAIEVKEKIYKGEGSSTLASITYQSFFKMYPKISGMTGTAKTEDLEFEKIYNLTVSVLPTFKPTQRIDLPDLIFIDEITKWKAVAKECQKMSTIGRPILVGTTTIQNSEILSKLLDDLNLPHQLLNAKPENVRKESATVAQAGCIGSITIATNMAGRGTDIILGGNVEYKSRQDMLIVFCKILENENFEEFDTYPEIKNLIDQLAKNRQVLTRLTVKDEIDSLLNLIVVPTRELTFFETLVSKLYQEFEKRNYINCKKEADKVKSLGGLYVIGTERHESRRIDNQLRGRAGRQGDPGSSRFFLSLNDPIIKIFGGDKIKSFIQTFDFGDQVIESSFLNRALESAQQKVEGFYYDQRKTVNKYDKVVDKQRELFYEMRKEIVFSEFNRDFILYLGEALIDDLVLKITEATKNNEEKPLLLKRIFILLQSLNLSIDITRFSTLANLENSELLRMTLYQQFWSTYSLYELTFFLYNFELFRYYEKLIILKTMDIYWSKHLENITFLKDRVSLEGYAQRDPIVSYEILADQSFKDTFRKCRDSIIYEILTSELLY